MNKNQVIKRVYLAPSIEVYPVRVDNPLLAGSVSGGHNNAGDDEELNAKQNLFGNDWQTDEDPWAED